MNGVLTHVKLALALVGAALLGLAFVAALPIAAQPEKPNANPPVQSTENPDPKPRRRKSTRRNRSPSKGIPVRTRR